MSAARAATIVSVLLVLTGFGLLLFVFISLRSGARFAPITGNGYFTAPLVARSGSYFVNAKIEKYSNRSIEFLIDTGSDHLWVKNKFVNHKKIQDVLFAVNYISGSASGYTSHESLSLAGYRWNQTLGIATSASSDLGDIDGIIGLSRSCRDRSLCAQSYLGLNESVFGFTITDIYKLTGMFTAGKIDHSYCLKDHSLHWIANTGNFFWKSKASIAFGDTKLGDDLKAVWDTGSSHIMLKETIYNQVMKSLHTVCDLKAVPSLSFTLNGREFALPGYLIAQKLANNTCNYLIAPLKEDWVQKTRTDVIIGWAFMRVHHIVFDIKRNRIGICKAVPDLYFKLRGFTLKTL